MALVSLLVAAAVCACSKDMYTQDSDSPPPYAASAKTWVFGEQVWSDAIRLPECNKEDFDDSYDQPQCRSYSEGANTWFYYNWPFVNQRAYALCPTPWRVPTADDLEDFARLIHTLEAELGHT